MEIDKKKIRASFEAFMKNPAWKKIYEGSPSEVCKSYWRFVFYFSKYYDPDADNADEFDELRDRCYDKLSVDDWEYIRDNSASGEFRGYINQRIKELKK